MAEWSVPFPALLVAMVASALCAEAARITLAGWLRSFRARRRAGRARTGEVDGEALLRRLGYRILERQPKRFMTLEIDGEQREVELRTDLLVSRKERVLVAEIKTGARAPSIETKTTRRQLLEYRIAYDGEAAGVLLVDAEAGEVSEVVFPLPSRSEVKTKLVLVALSLLVGALVGAAVAVSIVNL